MDNLTPQEIKIIQRAKAEGRSYTSAMSEVSDFRFRGKIRPVAETELIEQSLLKNTFSNLDKGF